MSNITLTTAAAAAITAAVSAVEGASRKMQSSIDALVAAGMRSTDFVSPKSKDGGSTASPEQFEAINTAIVAGFTARTQKLLTAPTKALPEADKAEKRYAQQQIGARRNRLPSVALKSVKARRTTAHHNNLSRQRTRSAR